MTQTFSKIISGLVITASLALITTGCKKEQNQLADNSGDAGISRIGAGQVSLCTESIPDTLKVPEGNKFLSQAFARGFQIYQVQRSATDPNTFQWVNIAPLATLFGKEDFTQQVATHFEGPTWQFTKGPDVGEKVVARRVTGITQDATAIQWLLLKAVDSLSSPGNRVTFIQRLCTRGGLAPTTGADEAHLGQLDSIPYTSSYLFYTAK